MRPHGGWPGQASLLSARWNPPSLGVPTPLAADFHQAIMESGSASFWTYIPLDAATASFDKVREATACGGSGKSAAAKLKCLLAAASATISSAVSAVPCRDACTWAPVVDGVYVRARPLELAAAGELRPSTRTIQGFNLNDGAMFVSGCECTLHDAARHARTCDRACDRA
eukprot:193060-Prymnesium_polylepis.1